VISEKASAFKLGTNFTAWACEVAKYKIMELRRRDSRAAEITLSEKAMEVLCEAAPDPLEHDEERQALANCIEKLAPRSRQIIRLRYGGGKRPAEIARRMSWKPPAVYVALSRSRVFLKNCVEQQMGKEVG
jgi:RNA polymerase sigma-70 factor (ECF subfamily)